MQRTPKGLRLHIGLFGRRNVGKSSLLNAITRQQVSIVSEYAGTTTDPVEKPMEFLPLGPVLFIDTAGIDDVGDLGELRIKKTRQIFDRTELGVIITDGEWKTFEENLLLELKSRNIPAIAVFNKIDIADPNAEVIQGLQNRNIPVVKTAITRGTGILDFRQAVLDCAPDEYINNPAILADLLSPGEVAVLVVPIDKEAPKGRLILPQVQTIRDLLDHHSYCIVVTDGELHEAINSLKKPPGIVVTDSQAFDRVAEITPREIRLTSFSILFARFKGDLTEQVRGTIAIERLKPGDRVLVAESCSHHPIADDIGRTKIPRWLNEYVGGEIEFDTVQGHDFPEDLSDYGLVIHCGACMQNRREMLNRILRCRQAGVPITNYGLTIAYSLGIFERALESFPSALDAYRKEIQAKGNSEGRDPIEVITSDLIASTSDKTAAIIQLLREDDPSRLEQLRIVANRIRADNVGNEVHLRGLIEFSNICKRKCTYCGINVRNKNIARYQMTGEEILDCAAAAHSFGYGTVVLQSGENDGTSAEWLGDIIQSIKKTHPLAVTLSVGERPLSDYRLWREKGADRYLLKFETSDYKLYSRIHPPHKSNELKRVELLKFLRELGYEIGGGIMVGLPDQTYESLVADLFLFEELDLDMIGIGPYIPHPDTPLGKEYPGNKKPVARQVPNTGTMTLKILALARIMCPNANIPATTALASINHNGFEIGLESGANVIMPNITPFKYRKLYQVYPSKLIESQNEIHRQTVNSILAAGRQPGSGRGDSLRMKIPP
ncbi:MAG: [FeFe] hydrogenase H-cluster maturation GTPase HydF [Planctomycetota bacterium]|jgi:[FeFe] hydrogenase H-cluster maturation GTPase HydF/[FeFe] hydrogenase H-cluster radical SAM maturase HydE